MENGTFEDVKFPIKNGDIPASYVSLPEGTKPFPLECSHFSPNVGR